MGEYDDVINLPHHVSKTHPQMPMMNRAAQFAPFSAVAGHDAAIREAGRFTDGWTDIADSGYEELNQKMELLVSRLSEHPMVTIEYFLPDQHKSGGSYHTVSGNVRRIDEYERIIELMDRRKIPIDFIKNLTL